MTSNLADDANPPAPAGGARFHFGEVASEALRYWEPRRGLVLANVAYCTAYPVDLFVQFSGMRTAWMRWRWAVLLTGFAFAAVLAHFMLIGLLGATAD